MAGKRLAGAVVALGLALTAVSCATNAMPKDMNEEKLREMRQKLGEGEKFQSFSPVEGTDLKHAQIYAVVDAPIERVWKVITDYNFYKDFMPLVERSRILWIKGPVVKVDWGFGLTGVPLKYTVVVAFVHYPEVHRIEWVYVEGEIKDTFGSWNLRPFGNDRTEVVYSMFMDLQGTAVGYTGPLVQLGSGVALPQVIDALRDQVKDKRYDLIDVPEYAKPLRTPPTLIDREFADFD